VYSKLDVFIKIDTGPKTCFESTYVWWK